MLIHFTLHRFKHQALSKRICGQLVRLPSLGLGRGVRCGQRIHGHLVKSFTVQKSFVKRIRVSELHLTACSLMDALLTSSLPCASVSCGVHPVLPQVRPHYPCRVLLSPVTHHSKSITKAGTVRSCVFLSLLLLLAGDVESNPGPRKGKEREASGQLLC